MHRCPECNERCDCAPCGIGRKQIPAEEACIHPFTEECREGESDGSVPSDR